MNSICISGHLGAGKTLGMTLLGVYFAQRVPNTALYSNYGVKGSKPFTHYRDFLDVAKQPSSVILLDEAHSDLDARNYNTNSVKFFTHLIFYLRKLRTTLFLATPALDNLDSRVRSILNLYCHVTKSKGIIHYDMYDMQTLQHLKRYKIKMESATEIASQFYDTYNMVEPVEFPQDRKEFNEFLSELKQASEEYYLRQRKSGALGTPSGRPAAPLVEAGTAS